jgi:GT2 family glycosyltransferase
VTADGQPSVTIVFLVHDRRDELRTSLRRMLEESDYDAGPVDVVVVDNASSDGSADMVAAEFPQVRLIRRAVNNGVSGFNDGFAAAGGDFVLALDDDCYLPADGLRRAVAEAQRVDADLVSFGVTSSFDPSFRFDRFYRTGLMTFWGCAVLMRREVLAALGGYDPEIFVWANELEFTMRFYDRGFRHLHLPEVVAVHMKDRPLGEVEYLESWQATMNARNFAYAAGKLLWPADATVVMVRLLARHTRAAVRIDRTAVRGIPEMVRGFAHGLRHRERLAHASVSRAYRRNLHDFASPLAHSRPLGQLVFDLPREWLRSARGLPAREDRDVGRMVDYMAERERFYPVSAAALAMVES